MEGKLPTRKDWRIWRKAVEVDDKQYEVEIALNNDKLDALLETEQRDHSWANYPLAKGTQQPLPKLDRHEGAYEPLLPGSLVLPRACSDNSRRPGAIRAG